MTATLTDDDRGKEVVHGTERVGVVTDVVGDTVYVDPAWDNLDERVREALGWDSDDARHRLDQSDVQAVRNDQVQLREPL